MNTKFQKGSQPFNKGMKQSEWMSEESLVKAKNTRFKKGQRPYTAPPVGTITIRTHKKTGQQHKYVGGRLLHHIEWEKLYGAIPKGYVLACKSADTLNENSKNWELLSRSELMKRNSCVYNLPDKYVANSIAWRDRETADLLIAHHPEIIDLKRHSMILNRKLNERKSRKEIKRNDE